MEQPTREHQYHTSLWSDLVTTLEWSPRHDDHLYGDSWVDEFDHAAAWPVGGYGAGLLARMVGDKRAREIWYLCRQYSAEEAFEMGMVNKVVPLAGLEDETVRWAREILEMSPIAVRMMKAAINAAADGMAGQQQLAGDATLLFYMSEEAQEGRDAFNEKRTPRFDQFPRLP